jgi:threonine/homoserine/homoserine lactone efflux protein
MFAFTLANFVVVIPYLLAFFAMFNVGMHSEGESIASMMRGGMTILGFFAGASLWWILLTFTIDIFRRRFRPRHMLTINHVAGVIIAVLGIYTILSTFFNILPQ